MSKGHLKIRTQLLIGFSIVLALVLILDIVSSILTDRLFMQESAIVEHPLIVSDAIDEIKVDIRDVRIGVRDYVLHEDTASRLAAEEMMDVAFADIEKQFVLLNNLYLGPKSDIESAYNTYISWKSMKNSMLEQVKSGKIADSRELLNEDGILYSIRVQMDTSIQVIENFASDKAAALNQSFLAYYHSLRLGRTILICFIMVFSVGVSIYLLRLIQRPLFEINSEIERFRDGDLSARSRYLMKNEFGDMSVSFNSMADAIQKNISLREMAAGISNVMMAHPDAKMFFRATLEELAKQLRANTAAVYLLNDEKDAYICYDSIGLSEKARESFDARQLEGEIGMAVSSRKVQYICQLQEDIRYWIPFSSGQISPHEIMTIPVVTGDQVTAVISLTSISQLYELAYPLVESVLPTISARMEGVLAYQTIRDILGTLEQQNRELDAQKNELTMQASELMQQNAELDAQRNQLEEASRLKTTFLSNMSHELRTPLNSIIALSGVLTRRLNQQIPEEELSYLEIVERNGRNLLTLINDILDISRIEAGHEEIDLSSFALSGVIADIVSMLRPIAEQKGIELSQMPGGEDILIRSDELKCRHILQNIVGNAVKFTESGAVRISARRSGNIVRISVKDSGIGISSEYLSTIFEEFHQADGTTSRKYGGTGLGLAIAKKYAELLGGSVTVTSALGSGSEFIITLPLTSGSEEDQTEPQINVTAAGMARARPDAGLQPVETGAKTILLIEDSEPAIIQIKELLEQSGHSVLIARSAREAYQIVEKTVPDAMILDLMMPEIDGFETLNTLRSSEKTADVPVLILTAKHIKREELHFLKKNHVTQVIQKGGVNRDELISAVSRMFEADSFTEKLTQERPEPAPKAEPNTGKVTILAVEDNADNRTTVRAILQEKYRILEAENGEQAIDLAKECLPDLILMDIALPGISGIDAFHAIRNTPATRHIPIVALTASAMIAERATILAHGFEAFVAKPIQNEELLRVIEEVLYD